MIGYLGGLAIFFGFLLLHLSNKQWYIDYLQNIMPENENPSKSEKNGAIVVIIVGILIVFFLQ